MINFSKELRELETEIFRYRKERRIGLIREAFAAYLKTLENPWWKRLKLLIKGAKAV